MHSASGGDGGQAVRESLRTGISFGLTSGVITTLGLMVGLHSGSGSRAVMVGGILTIAIADAFSDALGIHVSEEAENAHTPSQIWVSTLSTFVAKFFFALTFLVPVLLLPLGTALIVSLVWGFTALTALSFMIAKSQSKRAWKVVVEHLAIAVLVITLTHFAGEWIARVVH